MTFSDVLSLGGLTVTRPQDAARAILASGFPRAEYWTLFLLVIVLSGLLGQIGLIVTPPEIEGPQPTGLGISALVGGSILLLSFAVHFIGRMFGGEGTLDGALLLMIWLQFVLVGLQAVQTAALIVAPPFAGLVALAAVAIMFWALTNFIAVLHGFQSLGKVFLAMILTAFGLAFLLSILLASLGVVVGA